MEIHKDMLKPANHAHRLLENAMLEDAFCKLTSLRHLDVREMPRWAFKYSLQPRQQRLPAFWENLVNQHFLPGPSLAQTLHHWRESAYRRGQLLNVHFTWNVLKATRKLSHPLSTFFVDIADFENWLDGPIDENSLVLFEPVLRNIEHLTLSRSLYEPIRHISALRALQALLKYAQGVKFLELQFQWSGSAIEISADFHDSANNVGSIRSPGHSIFVADYTIDAVIDHDHLPSNQLFFGVGTDETQTMHYDHEPRLSWSNKLRELRLIQLRCTSDELQNVLRHCSNTLYYLELRTMVLLSAERHRDRACMVQLLRFFSEKLSLKGFISGGVWTNGGMQHWDIDGEQTLVSAPGCLRSKVHKFVVGGGECPLDHVAIRPKWYDLGKEDKRRRPPRQYHFPKYSGDASWRMSYYYQERALDRTESDDDTESDSSDSEDDDSQDDDDDGYTDEISDGQSPEPGNDVDN